MKRSDRTRNFRVRARNPHNPRRGSAMASTPYVSLMPGAPPRQFGSNLQLKKNEMG
jgi:hypothetical protein